MDDFEKTITRYKDLKDLTEKMHDKLVDKLPYLTGAHFIKGNLRSSVKVLLIISALVSFSIGIIMGSIPEFKHYMEANQYIEVNVYVGLPFLVALLWYVLFSVFGIINLIAGFISDYCRRIGVPKFIARAFAITVTVGSFYIFNVLKIVIIKSFD